MVPQVDETGGSLGASVGVNMFPARQDSKFAAPYIRFRSVMVALAVGVGSGASRSLDRLYFVCFQQYTDVVNWVLETKLATMIIESSFHVCCVRFVFVVCGEAVRQS